MEKVFTSGQFPDKYEKAKFETIFKRVEKALNTLVNGQNIVVTALTTSRQIDVGDGFVTVDASASAVTVTLPPASEAIEKRIAFKKIDPGANQVVITGNSGETIDGSNTRTISVQYTTIEIISDGTTWHRY